MVHNFLIKYLSYMFDQHQNFKLNLKRNNYLVNSNGPHWFVQLIACTPALKILSHSGPGFESRLWHGCIVPVFLGVLPRSFTTSGGVCLFCGVKILPKCTSLYNIMLSTLNVFLLFELQSRLFSDRLLSAKSFRFRYST